MKKSLLVSVLLICTLLSCKDNDDNLSNTCNVSNPIEDLSWLKNKILELEETSLYQSGEIFISQAKYRDKTIFILNNCCAVCNTIVPVFNCEGEAIGYMGDDSINSSEIKENIIIWKPENFICI